MINSYLFNHSPHNSPKTDRNGLFGGVMLETIEHRNTTLTACNGLKIANMNRVIKFRGQQADNKEWVYGYYVVRPDGLHLIYYQPFEGASSNTYHHVWPNTIGQFTGLHDKNGVEIYEGDIVRTPCGHSSVEFSHGVFGLNHNFLNPEKQTMLGSWGQEHNLRTLDDGYYNNIEVTGNIHQTTIQSIWATAQ